MYSVLCIRAKFWYDSVAYTHMLLSNVIKPFYLFSLGWILLWLHSGWSGFQWRWVRFCLYHLNYIFSFEQCSAIIICTYVCMYVTTIVTYYLYDKYVRSYMHTYVQLSLHISVDYDMYVCTYVLYVRILYIHMYILYFGVVIECLLHY